MRADQLERYVARLRAEGAGYHSINVDIPYMVGRKRHEHWA